MKCPICNKQLEVNDDKIICESECGAEFGLEYLGVWETPEQEDRFDSGFESDEWLKKHGKQLRKAREELRFV